MSRQYFGTDGVRGRYGGPVINENFARRLGLAAARWLPAPGRVVIGRDTRYSGPSLQAAVARGLAAGGCSPVSVGVLPTPAIARAVRSSGAVLGVVITASHNPADDNGIKFFGSGGTKLADEQELAIERLLPEAAGAVEGSVSAAQMDDVLGAQASADYMRAASAVLRPGSLSGWRIVVDTANGAASKVTPVVLRQLGAEVVAFGDQPDGRNINAGVGSEHPGVVATRTRETGARVGIAHDGDADRCVLSDEAGAILDGDEILTLLATHALRHGKLAQNTLVVTVQSNLGVDAAVTAAGGRVLRTNVGDRYVIQRMLAEGATLGGESSGHVICSDISPTGDGLVAALKVLEVMQATGRPLSELRRALKRFPQRTSALAVREKIPVADLPRLSGAIRRLEQELGARGRVLVRYSGTESKLRLLVEGPDDGVVSAALGELETAARADLVVAV